MTRKWHNSVERLICKGSEPSNWLCGWLAHRSVLNYLPLFWWYHLIGLSKERPNLMIRLRLKSLFQWNARISPWNVREMCIFQFDMHKTSDFHSNLLVFLGIGDWRISMKTNEMRAFHTFLCGPIRDRTNEMRDRNTLTRYGNSLVYYLSLSG